MVVLCIGHPLNKAVFNLMPRLNVFSSNHIFPFLSLEKVFITNSRQKHCAFLLYMNCFNVELFVSQFFSGNFSFVAFISAIVTIIWQVRMLVYSD